MGCKIEKDEFYMHVKLIGTDLEKFNNNLKNSEYLKKIKDFWKIDPIDNKSNLEQINQYFDEINQLIEMDDENIINIRECLIVKVANLLSEEVNTIIEQMDNLYDTYKMPLVLFLTTEKSESNLNIDSKNFTKIDPRLIFIKEYTEDKELFEKEIAPILVRFCSIHNDLGDKFYIGKNNEDMFDLVENAFPFNLNIACIGIFGQGKSTGVNALLNEYKAKESSKGCSQTKNLTIYQIENKPIRILDIPGFEDEETVKGAVEKFKKCGEAINKIKENIHIILYFLNFNKVDETRAISQLEYPMFEEISKNKTSKIIYVITRSQQNLDARYKKQFFKKINVGLKGILKNKPIKDKFKIFEANENNVVFLNFRKDSKNPVIFGKKELFKKIQDFFIESDTYKEFKETLNKEKLEKKIEELKIKAEYELYPNKYLGGIAGLFPFIDLAIQKYVIKKRALKKAGQIFGIKVDFLNEEKNKEEKKFEEKNKEENEDEEKNKEENEDEEKNKEEKEFKEKNKEEKEFEEKNKEENEVEEKNKEEKEFKEKKEVNNIEKKENNKDEEEEQIIDDFIILGKPDDKIEGNNNIEDTPDYIKLDIDKDNLVTSTNSDDLIKDSKKNKIVNFVGRSLSSISTATGLTLAGNNIDKVYRFSSMSAPLAKIGNNINIVCNNCPKLLNCVKNTSYLEKVGRGATFFKYFGIGTFIGIGVGAYCTDSFCKDLINKFADFYRNNAEKISNSYEEAVSYFNEI